jgi:predicted GIY-YIG superfamily endonuclease
MIQDFLEQVKSLPAATMSDDELKAKLRSMKEELMTKNNGYICDILANCGPAIKS